MAEHNDSTTRKGFLDKVFKPKNRTVESEMTFFDHLEALRWVILRSLAAIVILGTIAFAYKEFLFDTLILGPQYPSFWTYRKLCELGAQFQLSDDICVKAIGFKLMNTEMAGQFTTHISISLIAGLVAAFPYVFWEFWRFIKPALTEKEIRTTRGIVFFTSMLFLMGVLFGYYIITPMSVVFLGSYTISDAILNQISLDSYISLVTTLSLAAGAIFELPMVIYFLSKVGIMTPAFMRTYRKHAVIIILLISAFITPTPDIPTQLLVSAPLFLLYEISIFISANVEKKRLKAEQEFYAN